MRFRIRTVDADGNPFQTRVAQLRQPLVCGGCRSARRQGHAQTHVRRVSDEIGQVGTTHRIAARQYEQGRDVAERRELGLADSLVAPLPRRTTYVVRRNSLRTLPEASAMGLPVNWHTLFTASAFSWHGKVRLAAEGLLPPRRPPVDDESISSFVRRRFGGEAVRYVAEPLCSTRRGFRLRAEGEVDGRHTVLVGALLP